MVSGSTDGDCREGNLCDWERVPLEGRDHLDFGLFGIFHLRAYLVFSPLCPGVVGEEGSSGKESGDDADPEEPVEHTQLPVEDVPDAVDGRAGSKLCRGFCKSIVSFPRHFGVWCPASSKLN